MNLHPEVALAGARLVGRDFSWQPSARMFPSIFNDALVLTGLAARFPKSRFFGHFDRTWADPVRTCPGRLGTGRLFDLPRSGAGESRTIRSAILHV